MNCPACKGNVGAWPYIQARGALMAVQAGGHGFAYRVMDKEGEDYFECFHCKAWFSENGEFIIPKLPYKPWGRFRKLLWRILNA